MANISMIFPGSFTPPADNGATAGGRPPPWILIDLQAYIADRRNATTATATSSLGHTIQVSLQYAADPPAVSYLCVHCPCSKPNGAFAFEPSVVAAGGRFVLLWVRFARGVHCDSDDEYFMYKADPDSPSLERIRRPGYRLPLFKHLALAVVPLGRDGCHYLLASRLHDSIDDKYELHVYSSADQTWSVKPLPDACPKVVHDMFPDKVIPLGDGVVGWVDLRVGIAVCDLLRKPLDVRFIPLPEPMPATRERWERYKEFRPGDPAWRFRDVACSNGVLKFVEVEHRWIVTTIAPAPEEEPADPREKDVLLDSDLIRMQSRKRKEMDTKPRQVRRLDGWTMVTWSRPAMSSNCWYKGCTIDVDDIAVDDTITSSLRSGVGRDKHDESFKFRNMCSGFPTLSTDVDDLVYLKTTEKANDSKSWMVALDLGKKTLTGLGAYSFDRHDPCAYNFRLCSFSNYLNMDPAGSSQTTKVKDSVDPLKTRQSSAKEASCPFEDKVRDVVRRLMLEPKIEDQGHRSISEHGAESNEECSSDSSGHGDESDEEYSSDSSGPSRPPAKRRPLTKESDGAGDRQSAPAVSPVDNVVARPTGSCSLIPQVPVPPQQDFGHWSGAVNHPNAHAAFNHHPNAHAFNHHPNPHVFNHHVHDATGLRGSCPPPQPPVPQQNMYWNGVSYQNHPWTPPPQLQQYLAQAKKWMERRVTGGYQEQRHPYTHGVNQNHWNAAATGYHYPPSANVNLQQNQFGVGYGGHYSAPNLPPRGLHPAGQFPNHPAPGR